MSTQYALRPSVTAQTEGNQVTFTLTRSGSTPAETIWFSALQGTASYSAGDYAMANGAKPQNIAVAFNGGATTASVTMNILNDGADASGETFSAIVQRNSSDPPGTYLAESPTITIENPSQNTSYTLTPSVTAQTEGNQVTFTLTRSGSTPAETIWFSALQGTASYSAGDYAMANGAKPEDIAVAFNGGATTASVTMNILNDGADASGETFSAIVQRNSSDPPGTYLAESPTITIENPPQNTSYALRPSVTAQTEGNQVTFTVTRSGSTPAETIWFSALQGTASYSAGDYAMANGAKPQNIAVAFNGGATTASVTMNILNDGADASGETFSAIVQRNSSDPPGTYLAESPTITIENPSQNTSYTLTPSVTAQTEGNQVTFTLTRSGSTPAETIWFSALQGTASYSAGDYAMANGAKPEDIAVAFNGGATTASVTMNILNDGADASGETFSAIVQRNSSDPPGTYLAESPTITIENPSQNTSYTLTPSVTAQTEGNQVTFTLTRSGSTPAETIWFSALQGTASYSAGDYAMANGAKPEDIAVAFNGGATTASVTMNILNDGADASGETFSAIVQRNSSDPPGTYLAESPTITIENPSQNTSYTLTPSVTAQTEGNQVTFTLTRSGSTPAETIWFSALQGTASYSAGDYAMANGAKPQNIAVAFNAGATTATVTMNILNDGADASGETFSAIVQRNSSDPPGTYLAESPTITIENPSQNTSYTLTPSVTAQTEGNQVTFTLTRSGSTPAETIWFSALQGTASYSAGDYAMANGAKPQNIAVAFNAGATTATVTMNILNDGADASGETFSAIVQRNSTDLPSIYLAESPTITIENTALRGGGGGGGGQLLAGFDVRKFPGEGVMSTLHSSTNLKWCGYYLKAPSQNTDTGWLGESSYLESQAGGGWILAPLYVGAQDPAAGSGYTYVDQADPITQGTTDAAQALLEMGPDTGATQTVLDQDSSGNWTIEKTVATGQGFSRGTVVYLDWEGSPISAGPDTDYIVQWCKTIDESNTYLPGIYCKQSDISVLAPLVSQYNVTFWSATWDKTTKQTVSVAPSQTQFLRSTPPGGSTTATSWQYGSVYYTANGLLKNADLDVSASNAALSPVVISVIASPGTGDETTGDTVVLTVAMSEAVTVSDGTPSLTLNDGGTASYAAAQSSGTDLVFDYTVQAGQSTAGLAVTGFSADGATIQDSNGNGADFSGVSTALPGLEVNGPSDSCIVTGVGGATLSLPFDDPANETVVQPLLNAIITGITEGTVVPASATSPSSVPAGTSGLLQIDSSGVATVPAGYSTVVDDATDPVTISGGSSDGQLVIAGQGGLLFGAGSGTGSVFAGGGTNTAVIGSGAGSQYIALGDGNDTVAANGGDDTIAGGTGTNMIFLGAGNDNVTSGGNDTLVGGSGTATVTANGTSLLFGSAGSINYTVGNGGSSTVVGGSGTQSFIVDGAAVMFVEGSTTNVTVGGGGSTTIVGGSASTSVMSDGTAIAFGGSGAMSVGAGTGANATVVGGTGSDSVSADGTALVFDGSGVMQFLGGGGNATVVGSAAGTSTLFGGSGGTFGFTRGATDYVGGSGSDTILGLGGSLTVQGGSGSGMFWGSSGGGNVMIAGNGSTTIIGGGSGDVLGANGTGSAVVFGGSGAETISGVGSSGTNTFVAGTGNDLMIAGSGTNAFVDGTGSDTMVAGGTTLIVLNAGHGATVEVQDFTSGKDYVALRGFGSNEAANALAGASIANGSETIGLSDGTRVTFINFTGLQTSSFI